MNGRTATLIRKVVSARGSRHPRYIRSLKRTWYSLNRHERTEKRKEWKEEVAEAQQQLTRTK